MEFWNLSIVISLLFLFNLFTGVALALKCYACGWDSETSDEPDEVRELCWKETPKNEVDCSESKDPISIGKDEIVGCYSLHAHMKETKEYGRGCVSDEFYNCTAILFGEPLKSGDCTKFHGEDQAKVCLRGKDEMKEINFAVDNLVDFAFCYCSTGDLCNKGKETGSSKDNNSDSDASQYSSEPRRIFILFSFIILWVMSLVI